MINLFKQDLGDQHAKECDYHKKSQEFIFNQVIDSIKSFIDRKREEKKNNDLIGGMKLNNIKQFDFVIS